MAATKTKSPSAKGTFGWKVGMIAGYTYRSAKAPKGRVTAVHPGSTKATAAVTIAPAPKFRYGEGHITRHMDKIHHATLSASDKVSVKKK